MGLVNLIRFHFEILKVAFKTASTRCKKKRRIINNKQSAEEYSQIEFQDLVRRICVLLIEPIHAFVMIMWIIKKDEIIKHSCNIQKKIRTLKKDPIIRYNKTLHDITAGANIISKVYSVCAWSIAISATFGSLLVLIFDGDKFTVTVQDHFNETVTFLYTQQLPYYCWIPWNYRKSKLAFTFAIFFVTLPTVPYITGVPGMDILFLDLTNLIRLHMEILKRAFKTIGVRCNNTLDMEKELKSLIEYHIDIINYGNIIANYVEFIIFLLIISSTTIIGILLFILKEASTGSMDIFITQIFFFLTWTARMFFLCNGGQNVVVLSNDIHSNLKVQINIVVMNLKVEDLDFSVYESDWITASKSYKNSMKIILMRMKKPFYFRIGKFGRLDLALYTQILKTAYSFFALLQNKKS
ncbi:putative odorant receptor 85d [Agrilus planipennis]|uniref:Odorant receptor n=1 Tax=Agrilus planipennis TaxID=224129 RepID=A0A7F5RN75_AGRPL|nr:putative odorant receptor 85d [Agrilus planipennis]